MHVLIKYFCDQRKGATWETPPRTGGWDGQRNPETGGGLQSKGKESPVTEQSKQR